MNSTPTTGYSWPTAAALLSVCVLVEPLCAYSPPVDTAGPLTVRIEGPEEVTQTGVPLAVSVVLENKGGRPLEGTVRLGVVDRWTAEPSGAVPFAIEAGGTARREFTVTAGEPTYSAHYPIHAYVEFEAEGRPLVAHPILILETNLPVPPREVPAIEWRPLAVPAAGELALWRVLLHRSVVTVFGHQPKTMPTGWRGSAEPSGGSFGVGSETLDGRTLDTVVMHPPWRQGLVGTMLVEYPLRVPDTSPLVLRFAQGVTPTGQGDGVTFRVRWVPFEAAEGELGAVLFERHSDAHAWQAAEVDLSPLAGRSVRLQLEADPGPKKNTGWDRSFWAEPTLVCGAPPEPAAFPPERDEGSRLLGTLKGRGASYEVRVWPGERGLLDAAVGFRAHDQELHFRGFEVRVLGGRIDDARSPVLLLEASEEPCDQGVQVRHRFESLLGTFDLVGRLYVEGAALRAKFCLENVPEPRPWHVVTLQGVAAGPWSRSAKHVYAGPGNVIRSPETFKLGFDGHRLSTSFVGFDFEGGPSLVQGVDVPPDALEVRPDQRHYSLHAPYTSTWAFIPAGNVWDAVKVWRDVNGLTAAGGVEKLAGRFVFDLWGGRYGDTAQELDQAFRYGLTHSMVVWHNWQRWGYDYRLPDIYPPNPQWGTFDEMQELVETCKEAGVLVAPHDNYIDFYPDADGFSYEQTIAFHPNGTPVKAWLNEGRDARSYRYRADRVEPFLRRNLELIRDGLAPTAFFIDVWSSARPYDYWSADGEFFDRIHTRNSWGGHFAWIRDLLGDDAPQISESGHDQLIGWLDGAQTNHLRVGNVIPDHRHTWCAMPIECEAAERTCWFDAAHHDRFVLHGAGYETRYRAGLDRRLHGMYSDDYLVTEVLTGHPAMVSRPFGRDVVRKYWLTADLMQALALRTIEHVEYAGGDLGRQHVRWSGGGEVWVNRSEGDWVVGDRTLPEYGFLAKVPGDAGPVEASIERRGEVIVEQARSAGRLYVNGRLPVDPALPIRLSVQGCEYLGERKFRLALRWEADVAIPPGLRPFLHFCDAAGQIIFQGGHRFEDVEAPRQGVLSASAHSTVPEDVEPGQSLELCFGLYHPETGKRLTLAGPDVGDGRIRLGTIRLAGDGKELTDVAWTEHEPREDPYLARQNPEGRAIDFGPIVTAGACRLTPEREALVVTPLPCERGPEFAVRVRWTALPWRLPEPKHVEAVDEQGNVVSREPIRAEDGVVVLDCRPGVFCYRLRGE